MIKINEREKIYIYVGAGLICLFIIVQLIVFPFLNKKKRFKQSLEIRTRELGEISALASEYNAMKKKTEFLRKNILKKNKGFTLFSFLDQLAGKCGIKENISYMKPSTSVHKESKYKTSLVEMKVNAISSKQLVSYLHSVETSANPVIVKRISIVTDRKDESLDVVMEIETHTL